ncbi:DUF397 domain-containing protein [Streptomyces griseocarneus]|nr:DUF397 domain-containing protein [Streptomyces griseocarneus]
MSNPPEWSKSSYSGGGGGSTCVETAAIRTGGKSSYSGPGGDSTCVEAFALHAGDIRVRDSKLKLRARKLAIPTHAWAEFISHTTTVA